MDDLTFSAGMALIMSLLVAAAAVCLWLDSRSMRRRRRRREAYQRYVESIDAQARFIVSGCFKDWRKP